MPFVAALALIFLCGCERLFWGDGVGAKSTSAQTGRLSEDQRRQAHDLQTQTDPAARVLRAKALLHEDRAPALQLLAIQTLAKDKQGAPDIAALMQRSPDPTVRLNAAGALLRMGGTEARGLIDAHYQSVADPAEKARLSQAYAAFGER